MKLPCLNQARDTALTLFEVIVVIVVLSVLAVFLFPILARGKRDRRLSCVNNLMQIGIASKIWAEDHNNKYPFEVSATNGGTMGFISGRNVWLNFLVMSNELSTPKVLVCPKDAERQPAASKFTSQLAGHVSYFICLDARPNNPQRVLAGDDNLVVNDVPVRQGILNLPKSATINWTEGRHHGFGNTLFANGCVLSEGSLQFPPPPFRSLQQAFEHSDCPTNRLAIP